MRCQSHTPGIPGVSEVPRCLHGELVERSAPPLSSASQEAEPYFSLPSTIQAWHVCQPSPVTCFAFVACLTTAAWALPLPAFFFYFKKEDRISSHTQIPFIPIAFPSLGVFLQPERIRCPQPTNFPFLTLCACLYMGWLPVV